MKGIQVSHHHISSRMGETLSVNLTTAFPCSSGVQATDHQTRGLDDRKQTRGVGDHEAQVETELPEWLLPFTEGCRQTSLQLTWRYRRRHFLLPRILQQNLLAQSREKAQCISHFPKDPSCEVCRRTKSYGCALQKKSSRSGGQSLNRRIFWRYDNSRPQGSQ